jgi:hypothetical protein
VSDKELLTLAEDKLNASRKAEDFSAAKEMAHESIAASLLVIARNSKMVDVEVNIPSRPERPQANPPEKIY